LTTRTSVRYALYGLYQGAGRFAAKFPLDFQPRGESLKYEKQIPSSATHRMVVPNGSDPVPRLFLRYEEILGAEHGAFCGFPIHSGQCPGKSHEGRKL
jgi:hypothetical protein